MNNNLTQIDSNRVEYVDVLRGIGIILMILGHIGFGATFDIYIHAFHMPLFFFVSGFFYQKDSHITFKEFLKKISKQLLIPYLFWGIFCIIFYTIYTRGNKEILLISLKQMFTINNNGFPIAGALWFLSCMFFCKIILYVLGKNIKKETIFGSICILLMIIGIYFQKIFNIRLWYSIDTAFVGVGLIYLGYLFNRFKLQDKIVPKNLLVMIILFIINYFCIIKTNYVNMRTDTYPNILLFLFNFIVSQIVYISISKILLKYNKINLVTRFLKFIGKNSICFLCLNELVIFTLSKLFIKIKLTDFIFNNLIISPYLYNAFIFISVMIILCVGTKISSNTKLKKIFGK